MDSIMSEEPPAGAAVTENQVCTASCLSLTPSFRLLFQSCSRLALPRPALLMTVPRDDCALCTLTGNMNEHVLLVRRTLYCTAVIDMLWLQDCQSFGLPCCQLRRLIAAYPRHAENYNDLSMLGQLSIRVC